jgi:16S rRNA (guanine(1405)-N(7))-methyltransferase
MDGWRPVTQEDSVDRLLKEVRRSPKYRFVCQDAIENIGKTELAKRRSFKAAVKATKDKLHQIGGAYFRGTPKYATWLDKLRTTKRAGNEEEFRSLCIRFMSFHSSTLERLGILDGFYASLFSRLPAIHSILDVACGLNPLAIPWMPIAGSTDYYAYDIYTDLIEFIGDFVKLAGAQPHAHAADVLHNPPTVAADLALVLKNVPCFDQIDKAATAQLVDRLDAKYVLVSFPRQSLGGTGGFLTRQYAARFAELVKGRHWVISRMEYKTELVFLIDKTETRP